LPVTAARPHDEDLQDQEVSMEHGDRSFLEELRRRRGEMRESIGELELALSAPAAADRAQWVKSVHAALVDLSGDLQQHVDITEGPEGLYGEVLSAAPRLADAVSRLTEDHGVIRERLDGLLARVDSAANLEDVTVVRDLGTELLANLVRHRQHGADLVFEAYEFDVGGGET
jgi:hypothetical protein